MAALNSSAYELLFEQLNDAPVSGHHRARKYPWRETAARGYSRGRNPGETTRQPRHPRSHTMLLLTRVERRRAQI